VYCEESSINSAVSAEWHSSYDTVNTVLRVSSLWFYCCDAEHLWKALCVCVIQYNIPTSRSSIIRAFIKVLNPSPLLGMLLFICLIMEINFVLFLYLTYTLYYHGIICSLCNLHIVFVNVTHFLSLGYLSKYRLTAIVWHLIHSDYLAARFKLT
jgi:hypothetical protein